MPIPDETVFGPNVVDGQPITYGELRKITDEALQIDYLKERLDGFLLRQVAPLAARHADGKLKLWCPFPLTVLTYIGAETLGRVIKPIDQIRSADVSREVSIYIFGKLDQKLTRKPKKLFKQEMQDLWPRDDIANIKSYAEIFYKYLRSSFAHGYRSKNIFLDHELEEGWKTDRGFLIINPYWFWKAFETVYKSSFETIRDKSRTINPYRENALKYFNKLLTD